MGYRCVGRFDPSPRSIRTVAVFLIRGRVVSSSGSSPRAARTALISSRTGSGKSSAGISSSRTSGRRSGERVRSLMSSAKNARV